MFHEIQFKMTAKSKSPVLAFGLLPSFFAFSFSKQAAARLPFPEN